MLICGNILPASADTEVLRPIITVSSSSAIPGDTIVVDVSISENPGIMAMTFTLAYDPEAFTFKGYRRGILMDYLIVDHADQGYVSFVNCESMDKNKNGTVFAIEFTVNENTQVGVYDMKVKHIRPNQHGESMAGCFANWKGNKILPTVNNGTVTIGYTGTNCRHSFGEWETTVPAMCETNGVRTHTCTICGHSAIEEIAPIDHSFQDFWTIDREATADESGLMSRHCERCTETTDKVTFNLTDADDNDFSNTTQEDIYPESWDKLDEILKENEKEEAPAQNTVPTPPEEVTITPPTNEESNEIELPESAEELITAAKRPMGLAGRLYRLIFGSDSKEGIISLIERCVPEKAEWLFENPLIIIAAFAITLII